MFVMQSCSEQDKNKRST